MSYGGVFQAERTRRAKVIKSSSAQKKRSQNMNEGRLQSFGTFHMLDLRLHSCL